MSSHAEFAEKSKQYSIRDHLKNTLKPKKV
jgi:hypothetical protein